MAASRSIDLRRVGLAAGASVVTSAAWYTAWSTRLAELDEAYAGNAPPPAWVLPVELARSATVATAVAVIAGREREQNAGSAIRNALGLWAAFPAVLLSGSVVHEKVPWQQAAIHAGDWLAKLLLISLVMRPRR